MTTKAKAVWPHLLIGIALAAVCGQAYELRSLVLDCGGKPWMSGGAYRVGFSIGQQVASGALVGGQYQAVLGFWHKFHVPDTTGISDAEGAQWRRLDFGLAQCTPNPFRRATRIAYSLPVESDVSLKVYDPTGREVTTLVSGRQKAGRYTASWDVSRVPESKLPCGTYFCRLQAGEFTATSKMLKSR